MPFLKPYSWALNVYVFVAQTKRLDIKNESSFCDAAMTVDFCLWFKFAFVKYCSGTAIETGIASSIFSLIRPDLLGCK